MRFLAPLPALLAVASSCAFAQTDEATAKLAQQKNCLACHAPDKKLVGPSYQDVAKKYAGQKDAVATLAGKVLKGGAGTWGPVPMPPQPVTEAEARQLAQWILKQKP